MSISRVTDSYFYLFHIEISMRIYISNRDGIVTGARWLLGNGRCELCEYCFL